MPQLGLGLGINRSNRQQTPLELLKKYTSAMWLPSKASGQPFQTLAPRTLPNGVSNGQYTQNVSVDVVLQASDIVNIINRTNYAQAFTLTDPFPNLAPRVDAIQGIFVIPGWIEKAANTGGSYVPNLYSTRTLGDVFFDFPLNTTLEQARTLLAGTVIRYQLATPIDTLNTPFTNPLIDLKGNAPLTLQGFAGTSASGYTSEPVIRDNGEPVLFDNLLGSDGNMIDSNADNRADGWSYNAIVPISCVGNEALFSPTTQYSNTEKRITPISGDTYYFCANIKTASDKWAITLQNGGFPTTVTRHSGSGNYEFLSTQVIANSNIEGTALLIWIGASGFSNITVKQAHLFNVSQMFPNPATRPTKTQMDRLVQELITKYGYINEQIVKMAWVVMLKFDGTNDLGIANHPSLDITGTGDFAIECVFKTDATLVGSYIISKGSGGGITAQQYALTTETDGRMQLSLEGTAVAILPIGSLQTNSLYSVLIYRIGGVLKSRKNKVELYNLSNNSNMTTKPYFRVGARTNSADGLTHTTYTNIFLGHLSITNGAITPFTEADLIKKFDKFCFSQFGL